MSIAAGTRDLLVFARNPVVGQVKTRLIPGLGAQAAALVYERMLRDTLACALLACAHRRHLWVDRAPVCSDLVQLAADAGMPVRIQQGADLGERMHNALSRSLADADLAVLIGSDCPEFDPAYLDSAFAALSRHDVVLGPANDGGYVLIGLRHTERTLFDGIPWGTGQVLEATRVRLRRLGWRWHELPPRQDVDTVADLARFPRLAAVAGATTADRFDPLRTVSGG